VANPPLRWGKPSGGEKAITRFASSGQSSAPLGQAQRGREGDYGFACSVQSGAPLGQAQRGRLQVEWSIIPRAIGGIAADLGGFGPIPLKVAASGCPPSAGPSPDRGRAGRGTDAGEIAAALALAAMPPGGRANPEAVQRFRQTGDARQVDRLPAGTAPAQLKTTIVGHRRVPQLQQPHHLPRPNSKGCQQPSFLPGAVVFKLSCVETVPAPLIGTADAVACRLTDTPCLR
jgi:hypothetical protein